MTLCSSCYVWPAQAPDCWLLPERGQKFAWEFCLCLSLRQRNQDHSVHSFAVLGHRLLTSLFQTTPLALKGSYWLYIPFILLRCQLKLTIFKFVIHKNYEGTEIIKWQWLVDKSIISQAVHAWTVYTTLLILIFFTYNRRFNAIQYTQH